MIPPLQFQVLYTNIGGIYVLPKVDNYHMAIILALEHPLRQGATMCDATGSQP